ncbi:MAG: N-acetylmuramoyl-L-alanine amidase [Armatimonadetes bacterium]|nr:N-acetylmuramoyl-L-alanine amidase [Armatimonadota bacterium]
MKLAPEPGGIVIHSSDTPAEVDGVPIDARRINMIHRTDHPGWATQYHGKTYYIGYHYVILPDGTIQQGRPDHCPGCHARGYNNWLGICLIGAFSTRSNPNWWPHRPTVEEMTSLMALCQRLMLKYHIPIGNVRRHCDVNQTSCPGRRFPWQSFREELTLWAMANEANLGNGVAAAPAPVRPGA